jgi:hypothetical protein
MTRLLDRLFDTRGSPLAYALRAWPLVSVPTFAVVAALVLGRSALGLDPAIVPDDAYPEGTLAAAAGLVLFAPFVETFAMIPVLFLLGFVTRNRAWLAGSSAVLWAGAHSAVAPLWGLSALWPFFVFSAAFLAWRAHSLSRAYWVTAGIHALHNSLAAALLVLEAWQPEA